MKVNLKSASVAMALIAVFIITSCGNKGPKKGEDLKGKDALELLAGKSEKNWKLSSGDEFLTMMCFNVNGGFRDQSAYKMTYVLDGPSITVKDYKDFIFTIIEISESKMTLKSDKGLVLIYDVTTEKPKAEDSKLGKTDKKWTKGATYGTVWKGDKADYTYTFMNDGRFFDSNTGFKEETWSWYDDKTIMIGNMKCEVAQLTSLFFDIKMGGSVLKLNYLGEAGADGKPTNTSKGSPADMVYMKGDKVEILWNSKWYKGSVLETKGNEYKIHYDGWASSYDEWVKTDRLKLM